LNVAWRRADLSPTGEWLAVDMPHYSKYSSLTFQNRKFGRFSLLNSLAGGELARSGMRIVLFYECVLRPVSRDIEA
jgi:hypothetical protein